MIIRVLPELESRDQWLAFCRREQPYCLVERPECLVDLQTHFLQLTLFQRSADRDPVRYTLGSRRSLEPAWDLIRGCQWSLAQIVDGLEQLDFSGNVRDNALLSRHRDLSVRKRFVREPHLTPPSASGLLNPLSSLPENWDLDSLCRLIANRQWRDWRAEQTSSPSAQALLVALQETDAQWQVMRRGARLILLHEGTPLISLIPDTQPPEPRLAAQRGLV